MTKIHRDIRGMTLVETVVSLALFIPIMVLITFVIIEGSNFFQVARNLQIAAGLAARALATEGTVLGQLVPTQQLIFSNIVVGDTVVDRSQFTPAPYFDLDADPPTVTVYVQSKSTGTKMPKPFPAPDPLFLGANFVVKSQATYRLQL